MNTKSLSEIKSEFDDLFFISNKEDKLEVDAKILASRFLSIIQKELDENNRSRKELAELMGTSASYITQLFRGNKYPNFLTLAKMQDVLDIDFNISLERENISEISEYDISQYLDNFYKSRNGDYIKIIKNRCYLSRESDMSEVCEESSSYNYYNIDYKSA